MSELSESLLSTILQIEGMLMREDDKNLDLEVEAALSRDSRRLSSSSGGRKKRKSSSPKHR